VDVGGVHGYSFSFVFVRGSAFFWQWQIVSAAFWGLNDKEQGFD
jgi:hypothetical protein